NTESTGQKEFYLCEKWHNSKEYCYWSIKMEINYLCVYVFKKFDIKHMNQKQLDVFQKLNFYLFEWKQDLKNMELIFQTEEPTLQNEKEERLRLLLHILGTSNQGMMKECEEAKVEITEGLHDQIVEKLYKDEE
ncbi:hypothetical protein RFI_29642, partial [Reticulomyxa filosa]